MLAETTKALCIAKTLCLYSHLALGTSLWNQNLSFQLFYLAGHTKVKNYRLFFRTILRMCRKVSVSQQRHSAAHDSLKQIFLLSAATTR